LKARQRASIAFTAWTTKALEPQYLHLAASRSEFVAVNARSILVVLCLREKLYDEALRERALSYLHLAKVLDLRGDRKRAIANYQQVLTFADFEDSHRMAQGYLKRSYR